MKYILIVLISALFLTLICLIVCTDIIVKHDREILEETLDGYQKNSSNYDAPKTVQSTKIINFECEASLLSIMENDSHLSGRVYSFYANDKSGHISGEIKWYDRYGNSNEQSFTADTSFMTSLQDIVSEYSLSKHNGHNSRVSGLPDMYGSMIDIEYASGEYIYAFDNQDCFIPLEAVHKLAELFSGT